MSGPVLVSCTKCGDLGGVIAPTCARMDCPQAIALARASSRLFAAVPKRPSSIFAPDLRRLVVAKTGK